MSVDSQNSTRSGVKERLRAALLDHREGELLRAVESYQSVLLDIPGHPETLLSLGAALLGLSKYRKHQVSIFELLKF